MVALQEDKLAHRVFETSLGWCAAAQGRAGVRLFVLPVEDAATAEAAILKHSPRARHNRSVMRELVKAVRRYFLGRHTEFNTLPVDIFGATDFQQRVWSITRAIPYGQVRTYRWIAMGMGRPHAARAIGNALGSNPIPLIIPCHRIVNTNGALGGFSAPGGIELKCRLLKLECIRLVRTGGRMRVLS